MSVVGNVSDPDPIEIEHLRSRCRVCLQKPGTINIFMEELDIVWKLRACTDLQIEKDDGLPETLCKKCMRSLYNAYNFREKSAESDRRLHDIFYSQWQPKVEVKSEPIGEVVIEDRGNWMPIIKEEPEPKDVEYLLKSICARSGIMIKHSFKKNFKLVNNEDCDKLPLKKQNTIQKKCENKIGMKVPIKLDEDSIENKEDKFNIEQDTKECVIADSHWAEDINNIEEFLEEKLSQTCHICGDHSLNEQELETHINTHKNETFDCISCKKTFKGTVRIELHKKSHINAIMKVPCEFCGKTFHKYDIKRHIKMVHNKKDAECKICHSVLCNDNALRLHMKRQHTSREPVECNDCGRKFMHKIGLKSHFQRVHSKTRPHICSYCGRGFSASKDKSEHERLHTGVKPFNCPLCDKAFAQRGNMKSHFEHNHRKIDFKKAMQIYMTKKSINSSC